MSPLLQEIRDMITIHGKMRMCVVPAGLRRLPGARLQHDGDYLASEPFVLSAATINI
jgi:hypothetical protein